MEDMRRVIALEESTQDQQVLEQVKQAWRQKVRRRRVCMDRRWRLPTLLWQERPVVCARQQPLPLRRLFHAVCGRAKHQPRGDLQRPRAGRSGHAARGAEARWGRVSSQPAWPTPSLALQPLNRLRHARRRQLSLVQTVLWPTPNPCLQAMKAVSEVAANPHQIENYRSNPGLYKLLQRVLGISK